MSQAMTTLGMSEVVLLANCACLGREDGYGEDECRERQIHAGLRRRKYSSNDLYRGGGYRVT